MRVWLENLRWLLARHWRCALFGCSDNGEYWPANDCVTCGTNLYEHGYVAPQYSLLAPLMSAVWKMERWFKDMVVERNCEVCGRQLRRREYGCCSRAECEAQWMPF